MKLPINDVASLEDNEVKLYLEKAVDPDTAYQQVLAPSNFLPIESQSEVGTPLGSMILDSGAFYNEGTTIHNYRLRMWVDESAIIPSGESRKYGVKVNVYAKQLLSNNFTDESCFTFDSSTGTITDYDDNCPKDVVIPYTIGGVEVTTIGKGFLGTLGFYDKQLTSVIIPNSVTTIGVQAFSRNQLTNIVIPNSVTTIGIQAFSGNKLTSVAIPNNVTFIGGGAFNDNQLSENQAFIYQRNADGSIDYTTLVSYGGTRRDNIIVLENVTTIGEWAFYNNQLTSVEIPNSVTTIGDYAFHSNQLTSVTIPNSVTTIGDSAFRSNKLTNIIIPNTVKSIGKNAFERNELTNVTIPNSVTTIERAAFSSNQLISVTIPNSVTTIGDYVFNNNQLISVTIPNSVISIGDHAFFDNQLTSVEIPNSVTTIGVRAFYDNQLTSVEIPNSVTFIGGGAFSVSKSSNPNLTKIINKTGRSFDWQSITGGSSAATFVTGTIKHSFGNIIVTDK